MRPAVTKLADDGRQVERKTIEHSAIEEEPKEVENDVRRGRRCPDLFEGEHIFFRRRHSVNE